MKKLKRIGILLGVLVLCCVATIAVMKIEEYQEKIQTSDEIILELAAEDVQSLAWKYDETELAFHRNEDGVWQWDEDEVFPVNEERIAELLGGFASFGVKFIIEEVEDYAQYGLEEPVCTITLGTEEQTYEVALGDFSKLDEQRYVSIGDGNAYLVSDDPMTAYEITIEDMIQNDAALDYDTVTKIAFTGAESYEIDYAVNSADTYNEGDVYFTERDGKTVPLYTDTVDDYVRSIASLDMSTYVSYNVTEEQLQTYGLDKPELSITVDYTRTVEDDEGEETEETGSYIVHLSRSAEELAAIAEEEAAAAAEAAATESEGEAANAEETEENIKTTKDYVAYARVGDSKIIYQIGSSAFESFMEISYNDMRHKAVYTADFSLVTSIDVTLEDTDYALTTQPDEEDEDTLLWYYGEEEIEIADVQNAVEALGASEFTEEQPDGQEEIRMTLHLDNENFPTMEVVLYRHDGTNCLATIDGEPFALLPRSEVVDLIEAVNAIVLN